jgi:hypothetical protein
MDVCNSILFREGSDLLAQVGPVRVRVRVARVLVVVVGGETDADFVSANGGRDGGDDFEGEAASVFY